MKASEKKCPICGGMAKLQFTEIVLAKHEAAFHYCESCDYIFAAEPSWLEDAYADAIVPIDTDIASRSVFTAIRLSAILFLVLGQGHQGRYVDVAGGYGLLTRLMRDIGYDYFWCDKYAKNCFARGFEYSSKLGKCVAVSAIEVLEHTTAPNEFVRQCLSEFSTDTLIFTTELFPDRIPPGPLKWSYYSFSTGQHISFFSRSGLEKLARRLGLNYYSVGRLHIFSRKQISRWRIYLASNRLVILMTLLFAIKRLESRRNADQALLLESVRKQAE